MCRMESDGEKSDSSSVKSYESGAGWHRLCNHANRNMKTAFKIIKEKGAEITELKAALERVKGGIVEARAFSDEQKVGLIGQRIVDIIERTISVAAKK